MAMHFSLLALCRAILVALTALLLFGAHAARAQPMIVAQASDDDDDASPPTGETPAAEESGQPREPTRYGARRRIDPFDANEDAQRPAPLARPTAAAHADREGITCVAGCDGARGIVYKKGRLE
jgi:hypothetical protein